MGAVTLDTPVPEACLARMRKLIRASFPADQIEPAAKLLGFAFVTWRILEEGTFYPPRGPEIRRKLSKAATLARSLRAELSGDAAAYLDRWLVPEWRETL